MKKIVGSGAQTFAYYDIVGDYIFVLVRYPEDKLMSYANNTKYKMKLDPFKLKERLEAGDLEHGIKPIHVGVNVEVTKISPFDHIYARFDSDIPLESYWKPELATNPFIESVRLTVTFMILGGERKSGGAEIQLRSLKNEGAIVDYFPMPNKDKLDKLREKWLRMCITPNSQPFDEIREYFGEKMTLYFHFSAHLAIWLFVPAMIGLAMEAVVVSRWKDDHAFSHPVIPFFCLVIAVWSIMVTEYWKREEKTIAMKYGMIGFEAAMQDRPQFLAVAKTRPSVVTGKDEFFYPKRSLKLRVLLSFSTIFILTIFAVGVVGGIYGFRWFLYSKIVSAGAQVIASILNVTQIQIMTYFFNWASFRLTDMENKRTDAQYEDSMILKLFCFQFVNNYASFYYLAFVAPYRPPPPGASSDSVGECGFKDCMAALAVNLGITFGLRMTLTNFILWLYPFYSRRSRRNVENKHAGSRPRSPAEQEFIKEPFDNFDGFLLLYSDAATFFGYAVLFTAALPSAPFFAFVNKYYGIRFDAHQVLLDYRRPVPIGVEDIGNWQPVFEVMAVVGVITNAGLIVFTMTVLDDVGWTLQGKQWIFIGFQWFLFMSQTIVRLSIRDVPMTVQIQEERQKYYVSKVVEKLADEEHDTDEFVRTQDIGEIHDSAPGM